MGRPKRRSRPSPRTKKQSPIAWHRHGIRIAHHRHSGRRLAWHYTSYAALYFLIVITAALLLLITSSVQAVDQTKQGAIDLSGTVPGPPPTEPAVITSPKDGSHFSDSIIEVSGLCTPNMFIELQRNDIFAGLTVCTQDGHFSLEITLVPGANRLIARTKDGAGQYGPDSQPITVFYDRPSAVPETTSPFMLYVDPNPRSLFIAHRLVLKYEADGGRPPYAVSINWGEDTGESVFSLAKEGNYEAEQKYKSPGQYTVKLLGSDSLDQKATIGTIVVVQSANAGTAGADACGDEAHCVVSSRLLDIVNRYLWPATILSSLMTFSFWLGEHIVFKRLKLRHRPS